MKITTHKQAITYLENFIRPSIFRSITLEEAAKLNPLLRMQKLLELLGDPHKKFRCVQITGTSGKGSTSYLISKILTQAGYKTGLTISPHIQIANERIQINNKQINDKEFIEVINTLPKIVKKMEEEGFEEPTYYEMLLSIAFVYFAQQKVDIAVVEVGIEGKYDATNLIDAPVVVMTNIGLDHTEILGDTVEKIADEAVFAIRKNSIVVTGEEKKEVLKIINDRCRDTNSKLLRLNKDLFAVFKNSSSNGVVFDFKFGNKVFKDISLSLAGDYQAENAAFAITAVLNLEKLGFTISEKDIRSAMSNAFFPGRFEIVNFGAEVDYDPAKRDVSSPRSLKVVLDGAHNVDKMKAFLTSLDKYFPDEKKIFLIAFKKDKNATEMVSQIQKYAEKIIFSKFSVVTDMSKNPSYKIGDLKHQFSKFNNTLFEPDPEKALELALSNAGKVKNSILVVTGSLYFVGEIRSMLFANRRIY